MRLSLYITFFGQCSDAFAPPTRVTHFDGTTTTTTRHTATSLLHASSAHDEATVEIKSNSDDDSDDRTMIISKVKWKKKRFLMLKDVNKAIQTGNPRAARKAEHMVRRMWQLYDLSQQDDDFKPNLQVYNLWIHAVAKSKSKDCGPRAEAIIAEMQQHDVIPNVISFTNVMDAYANQARLDNKAPEHAERVLFDLIARSEVDHSLTVTAVTADVAMNAWAQQGTWQGALRAQQILDRMESLSSSRGSLRPTVHSYATVIHGWAQAKGGTEAAQRAQRVLQGLLRNNDDDRAAVEPDTVVFNAVIDAWSSSGDARAGSKALGLLNKMKELSKTKGCDCEPDVVTYNTVSLSVYTGRGDLSSAQLKACFFVNIRSCLLGLTVVTSMRRQKRNRFCNPCWKLIAISPIPVPLPTQCHITASCTLGVVPHPNLLWNAPKQFCSS